MRGRSIRFRGGVLDGIRVVKLPLPPTYTAPVPVRAMCMVGSGEIPDRAPLNPTDEYHLVRYIDETGIPEMQYHLRRMVR